MSAPTSAELRERADWYGNRCEGRDRCNIVDGNCRACQTFYDLTLLADLLDAIGIEHGPLPDDGYDLRIWRNRIAAVLDKGGEL